MSIPVLLQVMQSAIKREKKRKVYASRHGLWEDLDRPMTSRPPKGVAISSVDVQPGGCSDIHHDDDFA